MPGVSEKLRRYLDQNGVSYEIIHHPEDYRARDTAIDTETPAREFAKTVFLSIDGSYAMAVLPASEYVSSERVRRALGASEVVLAPESASKEICPDSEIGAAPPFGNLYGIPVYVSRSLTRDERITFNAGSHTEAIRMAFRDYERLVKPHVVGIARDD
jgi:Ala-tRNA(Pro) deacylase